MKTTLPATPVRRLPENLPSVINGGFESLNSSESLFGKGGELREYIRLLIKYRLVILGGAILGTIVALVMAFTVSPRYTAISKIRIGTYEPLLASTRIEEMLQQKSQEGNYLETQIEEIKSFSLVDRILADPDVRGGVFGDDSKNNELSSDEGSRYSDYKFSINEIERYLAGIEVRPIRRTSLVVLEATAKSPEVAALIANRHATEYIDWVRDKRVEQQARGLTFLKGQADELREKVASIEREMADYAEANSIVAVNKDENITAQRMADLNRKLTEVTGQKIEAENRFLEAQKGLKEDGAAGFEDSSMQNMRQELAKLQAELGLLSAKFTPEYPRVQQLSAQVGALKKAIENHGRTIVAGLKARYQAALEEEKRLNDELEQQKSKTFDLSKRQVHYNVLQRELTTSRSLLESVLQQIKETSLSVESKASNVAIVDLAVVPTIPSYPRKKLWIFIGMIFGLAVGVSAAFLLSYLDDTVRTPEDAIRVIGLPNLGVVPSFDIEPALPNGKKLELGFDQASASNSSSSTVDGRSLEEELEISSDRQGGDSDNAPVVNDENSAMPIVFVNNPKSLASEAYRTIRTAVLLSQAGQPPRTILVTSAQSSEGKTTSSVNLAASLASAGGRVVLIDADLRRPSVHRHLSMQRDGSGLVDVITGQRELSDVLIPNVVKRITFLPTGRIPPNPAELLGSLEMAAIIDTLSGQFDYVIIDSPPILPVTDSVILSRYVDGVVLVVRGASTPRKVISDACTRLRAVGARVLGTILNDVDVTAGDYTYYSQYYYSYYTRESDMELERHTSA